MPTSRSTNSSIEQLAGDELVTPPYKNLSPSAIEKLTATGFLRMAADGTATAGGALPVASNQVVADTIKIVSTSLLGLSVGCAQCHDHRYDPILQDDYYRLRAVFEPALNWKNWRVPAQRRVSLYTDADRARVAASGAEANKAARAYAEKERKLHRSRTRQRAGEVRTAAGQTAQGGLRHAGRQARPPNRNRC